MEINLPTIIIESETRTRVRIGIMVSLIESMMAGAEYSRKATRFTKEQADAKL